MSAPVPKLTYHVAQSGVGLDLFDGPLLHTVTSVSAGLAPDGQLDVWVHGPMRRKDGSRGRHQRCSRAWVDAGQPGWLYDIIKDAYARLRVVQS